MTISATGLAAATTSTKSATATTSTTSTTSTTGTGSKTGGAAGLGKNDFLQLMIAQMKNQDPMQPTDDKEFVTQLAQFNSLESLQNMTDQLETLTGSQMLVQAATLLGKQVTAKLTTGETVSGTISQVKMQDGKPIAVVNGTDIDTSLITQVGS